jgi:hypothetical protein
MFIEVVVSDSFMGQNFTYTKITSPVDIMPYSIPYKLQHHILRLKLNKIRLNLTGFEPRPFEHRPA